MAKSFSDSLEGILHIKEESLCFAQGKVVDGQYVRGAFVDTINSKIPHEVDNKSYWYPVVWDAAHWFDIVFRKMVKSTSKLFFTFF